MERGKIGEITWVSCYSCTKDGADCRKDDNVPQKIIIKKNKIYCAGFKSRWERAV